MGSRGKYEPLRLHLFRLPESRWHTTFVEIERLLGETLPPSARYERSWWGNSDHSQANAWRDAGWGVDDVNLTAEHVTFVRRGRSTSPLPMTAVSPPQPSIATQKCEPVRCGLEFEWEPIGQVERSPVGKLLFPAVGSKPGLYRFSIRLDGIERIYVGQTSDLARRFVNYRNPGPTQPTNLRLNALMLAALLQGAEIAVWTVTARASTRIDLGHGYQPVALSDLAERCLLENAALLATGGTEVELLNRGITPAAIVSAAAGSSDSGAIQAQLQQPARAHSTDDVSAAVTMERKPSLLARIFRSVGGRA